MLCKIEVNEWSKQKCLSYHFENPSKFDLHLSIFKKEETKWTYKSETRWGSVVAQWGKCNGSQVRKKNPENSNNFLIRVRLFNDSPALFGPFLTPLRRDTRYYIYTPWYTVSLHRPCVVHRMYEMRIDKIIDNLIKNIGFSIFAVIKDSLSSLTPSNNLKRQSD